MRDNDDAAATYHARHGALYIKLGQGGRWEAASLDGDRIDYGFASDDHTLASEADWAAVHAGYVAGGVSPSTATGYTVDRRRKPADFS